MQLPIPLGPYPSLPQPMTPPSYGGLSLGVSQTAAAQGQWNGEGLLLANGKFIRWLNSTGSSVINVISLQGDNNVYIGLSSSAYGFGIANVFNANGGDIVVGNNTIIRGINNAGNSTVGMIQVSGAADAVVISPSGNPIKIGRPTVALGGGAAPTLGTIGGSGPTTAAQNSWLPFTDSAGNARFLPVWA